MQLRPGFYYVVLFLFNVLGRRTATRMTNELRTCIPYRVLSWILVGKEVCISGSQGLQIQIGQSGCPEILTSKF